MRDFKGMKRQRGRNRKPGGGGNANAANPNRSWDSQGPENIKVRGNAQTVYERYQQLARDASSSGDRVLAENYLQHAEHYFRVLRALQPQRPVSDIAARELSSQGFDIDFEDESGAQAAAFIAAQQAAEQAQRQQTERERENRDRDRDNRDTRDRDNRDTRDRDNRDRDDRPREAREWRDRDDREPRGEAGDGAQGEGGRRESRRERWERRRDERNRRFDGEASGDQSQAEGDAPGSARVEAELAPSSPAEVLAGTPYEPAADDARPARGRSRRAAAQADAGEAESAGLPGFLTRPSPVRSETPAEAADAGEAPAPRRRAPRRRTEAPAGDE